MARDYSSGRFRCRFCGKSLKGYVPKDGDGTGFLIPRHKDSAGQRCKGTGELKTYADKGSS